MPLASFDFVSLSLISRGSNLARAQVQEVQKMVSYFYPKISLRPHFVDSKGDKDKLTSLRGLEKTNFFTDTLDHAILSGTSEVAVHSAKDLPEPLFQGLTLAAITPCIDSRDALVFAKHINADKTSLSTTPLRVATSSRRREDAVLEILPHASFCDLRGTIEERLQVLETGTADAVVLAEAALVRLGLTHLPRIYLPGKTTSGQGSLAIVVREDRKDLIELFSVFDIRQNRPKCLYLGIDPSSYQKRCPFPLFHYPLIETVSFLENDPALSAQAKAGFLKATHVIVTSPRAAYYINEWMKAQKIPVQGKKIWWCMGQTTAAVLNPNIKNKRECPSGSTAEHMVSWIKELDTRYNFVFFPHSQRSRPLLKEALEVAQIPHLALSIYNTQFKEIEDWGLIQEADELIFSSPSCVQALYAQGTPPASILLRSIGPVTELTLQKYIHDRYTAGTAL